MPTPEERKARKRELNRIGQKMRRAKRAGLVLSPLCVGPRLTGDMTKASHVRLFTGQVFDSTSEVFKRCRAIFQSI